MAILKHIASKSSNYGAALEYLIFKHDELRKTPILDQNGNRIMRDEFYLDGLNCEPYSFDAACQQLNREYQKNKNKNEIKSHHYIISFDPRDSTENCLTGKRAQELGLEYAKANFPGHQALVCTHMDGHNGSGNIHVHIVINSLRKLDVPKQSFMERPIDCKAGYKHHVTNEYLKHLQKSLMDLCRREFLHQVDLLSPSRTGVTEAEYWAQRRLDEKKLEIEREGFTPNPTKFQTQKQLIRDAVAAAREKAISYEDFQNILQDEYDIFVKAQRGRYSYLPPERNKFISERSLGDSCKRECLEGFFVQNAEKNLRYKEDPCEEIWLAMPHRSADDSRSVLFNCMVQPYEGYALPEDAMDRWARIAAVRTAVNGALEQARADKTIGKSLEAEVDVTVPAEDAFLADMDADTLADLLIVSQVRVTVGNELTVTVAPARGVKCARCWKVLSSVGTVEGHDTLCPRCAAVVKSLPVVE